MFDGGLEASSNLEELAALRVERDLLRAENARLWSQVERLTESVTRLALPPSKAPEEATPGGPSEVETGRRKRSVWDWFFGRDAED